MTKQARGRRIPAGSGGAVVSLGTPTGGAHLNRHWTAWFGTTAGVVEEPQPGDTFGGQDAGGMTGVRAE